MELVVLVLRLKPDVFVRCFVEQCREDGLLSCEILVVWWS